MGLIAKGAQPILGVEELLEALGAPQLQAKDSESGNSASKINQLNLIVDLSTLAPTQQQIMQHLSFTEGTTFDQLMERIQLPAGEVMADLLQLELQQYIEQSPVGSLRYR